LGFIFFIKIGLKLCWQQLSAKKGLRKRKNRPKTPSDADGEEKHQGGGPGKGKHHMTPPAVGFTIPVTKKVTKGYLILKRLMYRHILRN
jgi:hypothetical protein